MVLVLEEGGKRDTMAMLRRSGCCSAAGNLVNKHFAVGGGETVLITADTAPGERLLQAVADAVDGRPAASCSWRWRRSCRSRAGCRIPMCLDALKAAVDRLRRLVRLLLSLSCGIGRPFGRDGRQPLPLCAG